MKKSNLGKEGEERAVKYLKSRGYLIRERNYRFRGGEIDIIAEEGGDLVFVEVKSRSSLSFGLPQQSISSSKKRKILQGALTYLRHHPIRGNLRFDVVCLFFERGKIKEIEVFKNAFRKDFSHV